MEEKPSEIKQYFQNLAQAIDIIGPASNLITQFFFLLPERGTTLVRRYPNLMESEQDLISLAGLRYSEQGFVEASQSSRTGTGLSSFGYYLQGLLKELFSILSKMEGRKTFLQFMEQSEEEFQEIDPLRKWIHITLGYFKEAYPKALKVLNEISSRLVEKPGSSYRLDELEPALTQEGLNKEEISSYGKLLARYSLIEWYEHYEVVRGSPLALNVYVDLKERLENLVA